MFAMAGCSKHGAPVWTALRDRRTGDAVAYVCADGCVIWQADPNTLPHDAVTAVREASSMAMMMVALFAPRTEPDA